MLLFGWHLTNEFFFFLGSWTLGWHMIVGGMDANIVGMCVPHRNAVMPLPLLIFVTPRSRINNFLFLLKKKNYRKMSMCIALDILIVYFKHKILVNYFHFSRCKFKILLTSTNLKPKLEMLDQVQVGIQLSPPKISFK